MDNASARDAIDDWNNIVNPAPVVDRVLMSRPLSPVGRHGFGFWAQVAGFDSIEQARTTHPDYEFAYFERVAE